MPVTGGAVSTMRLISGAGMAMGSCRMWMMISVSPPPGWGSWPVSSSKAVAAKL